MQGTSSMRNYLGSVTGTFMCSETSRNSWARDSAGWSRLLQA